MRSPSRPRSDRFDNAALLDGGAAAVEWLLSGMETASRSRPIADRREGPLRATAAQCVATCVGGDLNLAAALPPDCAGRLVNAIEGRLTQRVCDIAIDKSTDDAIVSDLALILAALHHSCGDVDGRQDFVSA